MMRMTILILAIINFALFALALRLLFARERRMPLPTRAMVDVGVVVSCLHAYALATLPRGAGCS